MSDFKNFKKRQVCKCPNCGNIERMEYVLPCNNIPCPKCGVLMEKR